MLTEIDVGGIYMAPLAVYAAIALGLMLAVRFGLRRLGFFNWVWHPALFETGLYVAILSVLVLHFPA
ncbi:MAG: DUF1656 domain-containing protein [Parvibaculaceae bacterium]|nr:DUF1656 domain-containing protein [Parvibaculaceae bacterium]